MSICWTDPFLGLTLFLFLFRLRRLPGSLHHVAGDEDLIAEESLALRFDFRIEAPREAKRSKKKINPP